MSKVKQKQLDTSTEEIIKEAARTVFYKKGFAATRTRDIAEEAGLNLALLNYYFRSKAKLFDIIMTETVAAFIKEILMILNNENTSLEEKIHLIAEKYIDQIIKNPEIPTFIVTEIRSNLSGLLKKLPIKDAFEISVFFTQHRKAVEEGRINEPNPLHFLMNLMGLIVFPFIAKPLLMGARNLKEEEYNQLMVERKKMIPIWVQSMFNLK